MPVQFSPQLSYRCWAAFRDSTALYSEVYSNVLLPCQPQHIT